MSLSGKNNIDPTLWGPHFWKVIHLTSFGYPTNPAQSDIDAYKNFYMSLGGVLPCDTCSNSCLEFMKDAEKHTCETNIDDALVSRDSLIKWGYDFHNIVNKKLGKKYTVPFEYFKINFIRNTESGNSRDRKLEILVMILIIIIIFLCINRPTPRN